MNMIGRKVNIKSRDSFHDGGWGTVRYFDGERFHVAMYNGKDDVCVFSKDEIKIAKLRGDKCTK